MSKINEGKCSAFRDEVFKMTPRERAERMCKEAHKSGYGNGLKMHDNLLN
jgi:hypothetical protein